MTGLLFVCACVFRPQQFGWCPAGVAAVIFGGKRISLRVLDRRAAASAA
jgi:hypothetical protein